MENIAQLQSKADTLLKGIKAEKDESIRTKMEQARQKLLDQIEASEKSGEKEPEAKPAPAPEKTVKPEPKKEIKPKMETATEPKTEGISNEAIQFASLLQSFMGKSMDEKRVKEIAEKVFKGEKVGWDQLSEEVLQEMKAARKIHLIIPNVVTKAMSGSKSDKFWTIIDDINMHNNVYIYGEAGSGKTTVAKQVARALGRDVEMINCSQWTSPIEIIGGYTVEGQVEGKLIKAWRDGKMLILDEMPKLDPNTAGLLNDALALSDELDNDLNKISDFFGNQFSKHPNFCCIATGNVYPNSYNPAYPANNKQDLSLLDRFSGNVYEIPLSLEIMKTLSNDYVYNIGLKLREVIMGNKYEAVFSLRTIMSLQRAWDYESQRMKKPDDVSIDEGKTFIKGLDSYIHTFNTHAQENLKKAINYVDVKENYRKVMKQE